MTMKMKKGSSVREHVLNMINLIHEAEMLVAEKYFALPIKSEKQN